MIQERATPRLYRLPRETGKTACLLLVLAVMTAPGALGAGPAQPGPKDEQRYADCMTQARDKPQQGLKTAELWQQHGGGAPAVHCLAIALMGVKRYDDAAMRLESLADLVPAQRRDLRVQALGQAAQAWSAAGKADRALLVLNRALELRPGDGDLLLDRAVLHEGAGRLAEATADFTTILAAAPDRDDVLLLRASTQRRLGRLDLARADVERVIAINASNADALLERGNIRFDQGDSAGAKDDWQRVQAAAPKSAAAKAAAANLARLPKK
ncbi:MAG: tetratricopeptide repeat protein [Alphaproteobacteria bacterium]